MLDKKRQGKEGGEISELQMKQQHRLLLGGWVVVCLLFF